MAAPMVVTPGSQGPWVFQCFPQIRCRFRVHLKYAGRVGVQVPVPDIAVHNFRVFEQRHAQAPQCTAFCLRGCAIGVHNGARIQN